MPAAAPVAGLPSRLGKYELLMPLAAGGMARIYIGRSTGIGQFERHVVLKMITPERANDQVAVNMFLDEARLAASLNHQNVAQVFEVGEDHGVHYLAMEYVHGQDLRALLAKAGSQGTRIPLELALTVVAGAAAGLNHAHDRRGPDGVPLGIVHRDVSPSNIMIGYDGAVKLLDFGIAKATQRSVETQSGIIKGKFAYMAPEQCRGRDVDKRSDVFSLGIILYEISTQHRCFRADSDFDTMHRIVTGDVVRPTRLVQGYPQALEAIVMKALAVEAAQRYQSAAALLEALEAFAVSNRMSLSTMGLGRFMRDMFGEVQEPWLNTAATKVLQPLSAKENTISSTNGQGSAAKIEAPEHLDPDDDLNEGIPDEDGVFPDSGGVAMQTILDLPRGSNRPETEPAQPDWNAKSYPPSRPQPGSLDDRNFPTSPMPLSGGGLANLHSPIGQMPLPAPQTITPPAGIQHQTVGIQPNLPHNPPIGTQPMGTVPPGPRSDLTPVPHAFQTPNSGTGPPLPPQAGGPPIVSTKHGYASAAMSRGDVSYPGYAVPQDAFTPDVQLKPNRRPLFIGLGLAIVGIIVILAVSFSGKDVEKAPSVPPDDQGSATETNMQTTPPPPPPEAPNAADENMISVVVDSDPHGADVLVAGTKIGTTPLNKKLKKGTTKVDLKIHMDGYADFTTKVDTSANYENPSVRLSKVDDSKSAQPANGSSTDATGSASTGGTTDSGSTSTSGVSSKTGTQTTATGTKTTNTTGTKTGGTTTSTTGTKTSTGTKTTGTGTKTTGTSGTKTTAPKCQPPDHVDPFSSVPICPAK